LSRDDIAELALNNNHSLAQIHIYFIFIILDVHNTEAYYVETNPVVQEQPYDQYDIAHYVGTIPVVNVVNSSIVYVHIISYYTLVLYFYMYLSEMTFLTNSSPIMLIIKIFSYLMFCNGNVCYQQCMFNECKLP
jgi:hypothetical protein